MSCSKLFFPLDFGMQKCYACRTMWVATMEQGTILETVFATIWCKCGAGPFEDREAWVVHVREGMPTIARTKRPDFRRQEAEQAIMMGYIASHGILPEETIEKEC